MNRFRKQLSMLKTVAKTIAYIGMLYIAICYIDVLAHNLSGGTDSWWNLFVIVSNGGK